mgnify:CR=1 FL=1
MVWDIKMTDNIFNGLLSAIRADPNDTLPRLALCDWLEEKGTSKEEILWANFMRAQIAHETDPAAPSPTLTPETKAYNVRNTWD